MDAQFLATSMWQKLFFLYLPLKSILKYTNSLKFSTETKPEMAHQDSHCLSGVLPPFSETDKEYPFFIPCRRQLLDLNGKQFSKIQIVAYPVGGPFTYSFPHSWEGHMEGKWSEHLPHWLLTVSVESFSGKMRLGTTTYEECFENINLLHLGKEDW